MDVQPLPRGWTAITPADVAHALAQVADPAVSLFARAKYAGDETALPALERRLLLQLVGIPAVRRWRSRKDFLRALVRLAVVEDVAGEGLDGITRARAVEVAPSTWSTTWQSRYQRVVRPLVWRCEEELIQVLRYGHPSVRRS